ncbi:hypothetical protein ACHAP8_012546 [Fusarium lateritium]
MSQMHKLTSGQSEGHNYEDDELSSDESSISGGNRDRHNVQSQTTNAANISSLRVARSVNKTTQTALPNYRQISVISSPARSYKRHGTSTPLYALKRRRTDPAISNIDSNVASTIGPSLEPSPSLSKRPSTSALLLPKSVFENLDDDQIDSGDTPIRVADFTKAHDDLINQQRSISKLLHRLVKRLCDTLETGETNINTLKNKEPSLDKPAKRVARLEVALEECQAAVNQSLIQQKGSIRTMSTQSMMSMGREVQEKLRAAKSNLERKRIELEVAQDELEVVKDIYHTWEADVHAETEKADRIAESLRQVKQQKEHDEFLEFLMEGGPLVTERLVDAAKDAGLKFETTVDAKNP